MKNIKILVVLLVLSVLAAFAASASELDTRKLGVSGATFEAYDGGKKVTVTNEDRTYEMNNEFSVGITDIADGENQSNRAYRLKFSAKGAKDSKTATLVAVFVYWDPEKGGVTIEKIDEMTLSDSYYKHFDRIVSIKKEIAYDCRVEFYLKYAYPGDSYIVKGLELEKQGLCDASLKASGAGAEITVKASSNTYEMNNEYSISMSNLDGTALINKMYYLQLTAKGRYKNESNTLCAAMVYYSESRGTTIVDKVAEIDLNENYVTYGVPVKVSETAGLSTCRLEFYLKSAAAGDNYIISNYTLRKCPSWNVTQAAENGELAVTVTATDSSYDSNNQFGLHLPEMNGENQKEKLYNIEFTAKGTENAVLCMAFAYWGGTQGKSVVEKFGEITLGSKPQKVKKQVRIENDSSAYDVQLMLYIKYGKNGDVCRISNLSFDEYYEPMTVIPANLSEIDGFKKVALVFDEAVAEDTVKNPGNIQLNNSIKNITDVAIAGESTVIVHLGNDLEPDRRYVLSVDDVFTKSGKKIESMRICFETSEEAAYDTSFLVRGRTLNSAEATVSAGLDAIVNCTGSKKELYNVVAEYDGEKLMNIGVEKITLEAGAVRENAVLEIKNNGKSYKTFLVSADLMPVDKVLDSSQ